MEAMDISMVESKLSDVTVTPIPMSSKSLQHMTQAVSQLQQHQHQQLPTIQPHQMQQQQFTQMSGGGTSISSGSVITTQQSANITTPMTSTNNIPSSVNNSTGLSKYAQLLAVIEEMGRDIRPTYTGSRSSAERLKRGIIHARILVRECLLETERSARQ